jgi:hypothetical protein
MISCFNRKFVVGCALALLLVPFGGETACARYVSFNPPGSTASYATSIDGLGRVAGYYLDSGGARHGFIGRTDGTTTAFDPAGSVNTTTTGTQRGIVTGYYEDSSHAVHGFVRAANGTITSFDAPGTNTMPACINYRGAIVGNFVGNNGLLFGFTRAAGGATTIYHLDSGPNYPISININGVVAGYYQFDHTTADYGFVLFPDKKFVTFRAGSPGEPLPAKLTLAYGINYKGVIVGAFQDQRSTLYHGFERAVDGTITDFDPPGSVATFPMGINGSGAYAGYYLDSHAVAHAFRQRPGRAMETYVPMGATNTYVTTLNGSGYVAGYYVDANHMTHAFEVVP